MQIDLYEKLQNPIDAIDRLGEMFAKSGVFGCEKIDQGKVLAMACLAERKSPIQIAREYHFIEGRLTDRADAMLAKFKAIGGKYRIITRTPDAAEVELTHEGQTVTFSVTWEEIQKEPFIYMSGGKELKKNWRTPRARMQTLWARAVSDGVRTIAPEIVSGIYTPEEVSDEVASRPEVSINLGQSSAPAAPVAPATEPAKDTAIAVEASVVVNKAAPEKPQAETAQNVVPMPTAQAPAQTATVQPKATEKPAPKLPDGMVNELENAIGEHAIIAVNWMIKQGWITPGQTLADISPTRAKRIIGQRESFVRAILASKE